MRMNAREKNLVHDVSAQIQHNGGTGPLNLVRGFQNIGKSRTNENRQESLFIKLTSELD